MNPGHVTSGQMSNAIYLSPVDVSTILRKGGYLILAEILFFGQGEETARVCLYWDMCLFGGIYVYYWAISKKKCEISVFFEIE